VSADPVGGGCGCALVLAVAAAYFAGLAAWAFLNESGLLYPCVGGLALWFLFTVTRWLGRQRGQEG